MCLESPSQADRQNVKNIRNALYPEGGGLVDKMLESVPKAGLERSIVFQGQTLVLGNLRNQESCLGLCEAPYQWRHASLSGVADFLRAERDAGRFHPVISIGLDD